MRGLALILALLLAALPLRAEEVVMGLSRNTVAITADFDGSEVLIFGAVKREVPILPEPPLQVIVTVEGPLEPVTVWRKARRMGIWVNSEALKPHDARDKLPPDVPVLRAELDGTQIAPVVHHD